MKTHLRSTGIKCPECEEYIQERIGTQGRFEGLINHSHKEPQNGSMTERK